MLGDNFYRYIKIFFKYNCKIQITTLLTTATSIPDIPISISQTPRMPLKQDKKIVETLELYLDFNLFIGATPTAVGSIFEFTCGC